MNNVRGGGWGPESKPAALSVTLDNFGEAAEISFGLLPENYSTGRHETATTILPRLLPALGDLKVTYFIEGINAELYPRELTAISAAGHEIGLHAWRHEAWNRLSLAHQEKLLQMSLRAMKKIGLLPAGFRPPGGEISADALTLLRRLGFDFCSPLGSPGSRLEGDLAILPFQWRHVDAYLMDPVLNAYRSGNAASPVPLAAQEWSAILDHAIEEAVEHRRHLTVIFHPYLIGRHHDQWGVFERFLQRIRSRNDLWIANCAQVAGWIRKCAIDERQIPAEQAY
jgi:peptidoglycan/xylan/chitin deacetylase (PgdA/CDA1 family)